MTKTQIIKKYLVDNYSNSSIEKFSVTQGKGTAGGWVYIGVYFSDTVTKQFKDDFRYKKTEIEKGIIKKVEEAGMYIYTFTSDDGYYTEFNCINFNYYN